MSEVFNTMDRIKETLQWPPMGNQLVVYTTIYPAAWVERLPDTRFQ